MSKNKNINPEAYSVEQCFCKIIIINFSLYIIDDNSQQVHQKTRNEKIVLENFESDWLRPKRRVLRCKKQGVFFAASSSMNLWRIRKLNVTAASFVYLIDIKGDLKEPFMKWSSIPWVLYFFWPQYTFCGNWFSFTFQLRVVKRNTGSYKERLPRLRSSGNLGETNFKNESVSMK